MSRTWGAAFAIPLWLGLPAFAQTGYSDAPALARHAPGIVWHCWYGSEPEYATCFRPGAAAPDPVDVIDDAIQTMVRELLRAGNYMAATRVFRRFPESFTGARQRIPLHTVPFDLQGVARLAQSVMCARAGEPCAVAFDYRWNVDDTRPSRLDRWQGRDEPGILSPVAAERRHRPGGNFEAFTATPLSQPSARPAEVGTH